MSLSGHRRPRLNAPSSRSQLPSLAVFRNRIRIGVRIQGRNNSGRCQDSFALKHLTNGCSPMSDKTLVLHFAGSSSPQLFRTQFSSGSGGPARVSVRGKTSGAFPHAGSFHFSAAVRAACILCTKTVICSQSPGDFDPPIIAGFGGSLAASLDYALTKQPGWLLDMFGYDVAGRALGPRLFNRTNSHRKRPGPVVVSVNGRALPPKNIHLFWNGLELKNLEKLRSFFHLLAPTEDPTSGLIICSGKIVA